MRRIGQLVRHRRDDHSPDFCGRDRGWLWLTRPDLHPAGDDTRLNLIISLPSIGGSGDQEPPMAGDVFDSRGHEHRAFTRSGVSITASVREQGGGRQQVEVVDLSQAGFRMRTGLFIAPNRITFLTLPGYNPLEARIGSHRIASHRIASHDMP